MFPVCGSGRETETQSRWGRLRRDSCDRWYHSPSVSVGSKANNGSQIHFGISSSMRPVSLVRSFKWLHPSSLPYGLRFHRLCSLFPALSFLMPSAISIIRLSLLPSRSLPSSLHLAPPLSLVHLPTPFSPSVSSLPLSEKSVKLERAVQHFFGWLLFSL